MTRDLFGDVNAGDPVGLISDAGARGIFQAEIARLMGWTVFEIGQLHRLVRKGRVCCHRHGTDFLYYLPCFKGGILNARKNS